MSQASRRFVDAIRVKFKGGNGGDGCISFLHLFRNEFAGPAGGNGGNGGHVILKANKIIKSLNHVQSFYMAAHGERGYGKNMYGKAADHTVIEVPVGTVVRHALDKNLTSIYCDTNESDIIADLDEHESIFIAARGGRGGFGNSMYLSDKNRHPGQAEGGGIGEENVYELRMRIYAHIGLIGLPNVGKSSLLKALTGAQVKVGEYEFTTLYPSVGIIEYESDFAQVAISDLPGLIEESHKNRGLGVQFLRHVERCAALAFVLDGSGARMPPIAQLELLYGELERYKAGLSTRPSFIVVNKVDLMKNNEHNSSSHVDDDKNQDEQQEVLKACKHQLSLFIANHQQQWRKRQQWPPNNPLADNVNQKQQPEVFFVSARTGENLPELRNMIRRAYDAHIIQHAGETDALIW